MRSYEITAILREGQNLIEETKNAIKDILKKYSAEVTLEEDWGQKKLWHPIEKQDYAFFTFLKCKMEPSQVEKIYHEFKLNQNILHSMIAKG
jgi:small subunit ribosomal protein S6